jgi:hypothetical protein
LRGAARSGARTRAACRAQRGLDLNKSQIPQCAACHALPVLPVLPAPRAVQPHVPSPAAYGLEPCYRPGAYDPLGRDAGFWYEGRLSP